MSERVAIVIGAGGELGRATAEALAGAGYTVVGADRNEQRLKELPDSMRREVGDATDPVTAKSLIDRIAAEAGPPEVLVNTIGMFRLGEAIAVTPEDLKILMDVNLGSALWLSQAVEPYMKQGGKGSIVHVSARPGTDPTDPAAARSVVDRIAAEVGPPEVLVNTIGTYHLGDALAATPDDLRLMMDVNVGPALWLTQAVVPYLRDRG